MERGAGRKRRLAGLALEGGSGMLRGMSNRELVIDLVARLPEDMPLPEIAREIEFLAGVREGREQAKRGEGMPVEDARKKVRQWATKSS